MRILIPVLLALSATIAAAQSEPRPVAPGDIVAMVRGQWFDSLGQEHPLDARLVRIDPVSGKVDMISGYNRGEGHPLALAHEYLYGLRGLSADEKGNIYYIEDGVERGVPRAVVHVDPITGDRASLFGEAGNDDLFYDSASTERVETLPVNMTFGGDGNLYATVQSREVGFLNEGGEFFGDRTERIVGIQPASGETWLVSEHGVRGSGGDIKMTEGWGHGTIETDYSGGLFVTGDNEVTLPVGAIYQIDLETGDRNLFTTEGDQPVPNYIGNISQLSTNQAGDLFGIWWNSIGAGINTINERGVPSKLIEFEDLYGEPSWVFSFAHSNSSVTYSALPEREWGSSLRYLEDFNVRRFSDGRVDVFADIYFEDEPFLPEAAVGFEFDGYHFPGYFRSVADMVIIPDDFGVELTSGSPVSIQQTVPRPEERSVLEFRYRFLQPGGTLKVGLGGVEIASLRSSSDDKFTTVQMEIYPTDLPDQLSELDFELEFDAATGSSIQLDDIHFPGLRNGTFQQRDLMHWDVVTTLSGTAKQVGLNIGPEFILGDLNRDGILDAVDIDDLSQLIRESDYSTTYDLNNDDVLNTTDREIWLDRAAATLGGDANLDGEVDFLDFLSLAQTFGNEGGWSDGDFDGNGKVDFLDFLSLANNFGNSVEDSTELTSVPEPASRLLILMAATCLVSQRRSRNNVARKLS